MPGSLPQSLGRVRVRIRPRLVSTATTAAFALVLPAAAAVVLVATVDWGWLAIAGGLLLSGSACVRTFPFRSSWRSWGTSSRIWRTVMPR